MLPLVLVPFVLMALAVYYFVIRSYEVQIEDEQSKVLAEAIVNMRKEQEATRKDVALIASLPAIADYLEALELSPQTSGIGPQTAASELNPSSQAREAAARATLQSFFNKNSDYLQLSLADAQGHERIKFSKLSGSSALRSIQGEEFFRRTLINGQVQMPVEQVQADRFASVFGGRVRRERFSGVVVIHWDMEAFQRLMRPMLASHRLSTFLFDDRGLIFEKSFGSVEAESCLSQINLAAEAKGILAKPALETSPKEISTASAGYLFFVYPAEEFISFTEPVSGENWFVGVLQPQEERQGQTRAFQLIFFTLLVVTAGAAMWAITRYSRRITVPLEQVAGSTSKIARGQFDINLVVNTGDEVEELAEAVKQMADDLKKYQGELIKSAKLAAIGEMASEVSHEIQNRISGLSLWIQYLDAEIEASDPKREYLQEMKQGLKGFITLLENLKQFYRTPILHLSDVSLNELARESLQYIEQRIEAQKIEVEWRLDSDLPPIKCDPEKIKSVIINLLVNAVESGGNRIVVETGLEVRPLTSNLGSSGELQSHRVTVLSVEDNGNGIAEEDLPRIFYPFHSTKAGGSGLGLAIISNLVSAHGGKIEAQSQPGRGAKFTVTFLELGLRPSSHFQG